MIKQTEKTITTATYSASFFTNIKPELEHCFIDGDYCWQSDYENQIDIANIKGDEISKDNFHKVTSEPKNVSLYLFVDNFAFAFWQSDIMKDTF